MMAAAAATVKKALKPVAAAFAEALAVAAIASLDWMLCRMMMRQLEYAAAHTVRELSIRIHGLNQNSWNS
jgi:hypothetical protein